MNNGDMVVSFVSYQYEMEKRVYSVSFGIESMTQTLNLESTK